MWEKEFQAKGEKITQVLRKCLRTVKNTTRIIVVIVVVVVKMRIIGAGKVRKRIIFVKTDPKENKWIIKFGSMNEECGKILNGFT